MTNQRLESILADCLQAVAEGRASREDCLSRYPEHARALEAQFAVADRLVNAAAVVPAAAQTLAAQRIQQALVARNAAAVQPRSRTFMSALPKGVLAAVVALALTGGAAGASAMVGGPNIPAQVRAALEQLPEQARAAAANLPEQVRSAVGLNKNEDSSRAKGPKDSGKGAENSASENTGSGAPATPPASAIPGLCRAYVSGGGSNAQGQAAQPGKNLDAQAFQRLQAAAGGATNLDTFCSDALKNAGPNANPASGQSTTSTDTPTPGPTAQPKGGAQGNGGANAQGGNQPVASPTPNPGRRD